MAKKPSSKAVEKSPEKKAAESLLLELRDNYTKDIDADRENRKKYRENMRFVYVPGEQWDMTTKQERGKDRPYYQFNELRPKCKFVINQIRANRPSVKIRPFEEGDIELAEVRKGIHDYIWNNSDGDSVVDYCAEHQVPGGFAAARVITKYREGSVDEQDIFLEPFEDPMCVVVDRHCKTIDKIDAGHWIIARKISEEAFKSRYPDAEPVEFSIEDEFNPDCEDDEVWIAEYWRKEPVTKTLCRLSDGKTVDKAAITALPDGVSIVMEREIKSHKIVQYICSGDAILEGPTEWAGSIFPFAVVYGEYLVIDGKIVWYGLPEHAKDPQRAHNWAMTAAFEAIAANPKPTTWVTADQAKGNIKSWQEANAKGFDFKIYNADPAAGGPPRRDAGADVPVALIQAAQMSTDALKSSLGLYDASVGQQSNETSGVAIRARQDQGHLATYNFGDNMSKFVRRIHAILLDLAPKIIDTPRSFRILGKDGSEKYIRVNQPDPITGQVLNDLSVGTFDLVVTQGPSFATQRQEAAETYTQMAQSNPLISQAAGDLMMKAFDLPYAQEIADRLRLMLPPQIQQTMQEGGQQDPAVVAAMQQVEQLQAQLQEQAQLIEQASAEAQAEKAGADKAKSDVQVALAKLETKQANIATDVAKFEALVAKTQANFATQDAADIEARTTEQGNAAEAERTDTVAQISDALQSLQQQSAEQTQALALLMQELANAPKPKGPKTIVSKRVNGQVHSTITDEATGEVSEAISEREPDGFVTRLQPTDTVQ